MTARVPDLVEEEVIILLYIYQRIGQDRLREADPEVERLTQLFRSLPIHSSETRSNTSFRPEDGLRGRLQKFAWIERGRNDSPRLYHEVWEKYHNQVESLQQKVVDILIDSCIVSNNKSLEQEPLVFNYIEEYICSQISKAKESVTIFCPFVKLAPFKRICKTIPKGVSVKLVMRWQINDFLYGSSDPEMFLFCQDNNIELFYQNKIHLKIWLIDHCYLISMSANISERALGTGDKTNAEFLEPMKLAKQSDIAFLDALLHDAYPVEEEDFNRIQDLLKNINMPFIPDTKYHSLDNSVSGIEKKSVCLPQSKTVKELWTQYQIHELDRTPEANHDLATFSVPSGLSEVFFLQALSKAFLSSHNIIHLTNQLRKKDFFWHDAKKWLGYQLHDPISNEEMDHRVDCIYNWLPSLSNKYSVEQPKHSEKLGYDTNIADKPVLFAKEAREKREGHKYN
jgi:hypothetical protein